MTEDAAALAADAEDRHAAVFHLLADHAYRWMRYGQPPATPSDLAVIRGQLEAINDKLEKIMSEDAAIQSVTADLLADEQAITTALGTIQAALTAAQNDAVQPSTLAALQSAQAALDNLTATANSDASADTPASSSASTSGTATTPPEATS
jgi:hypothetical protein